MKISLVQSVGHIDDPTANAFKIKMRAKNVESDLFIFPEMVMCGYVGSKDKMYLKVVEGREMDMIKEFSTKYDCAIVCGGPRSDGDDVYNSAYFINGDSVESYSKMHLPSKGPVDESKLFKVGDRPLIFELKGMKFGMVMSYDIYFPELFRYYAKNDVDVVICIAAVPEEEMMKYEKMLPSRAVENSMHIAFVNMVGPDSGTKMIGRSRWIGPDGNVIEELTESSDIRTIRIDEKEVKNRDRSMLDDVRKEHF